MVSLYLLETFSSSAPSHRCNTENVVDFMAAIEEDDDVSEVFTNAELN